MNAARSKVRAGDAVASPSRRTEARRAAAATPAGTDAQRDRTGAQRDRAEAQRDRILTAAQKCFVEHGFHAASMSSIAQTSGMSAGLIYRYFESKSAIILAIIERQLAERREDIAMLQTSTDFCARIAEFFEQWRDGDPQVTNATLFLEMTAEASRDPQIARALRRSDLISRAEFGDWLSRGRERGGLGLAKASSQTRALILQCFFEGLAIRAVREPDLDPSALRAALEAFLPQVLSER